MYELVNRTVRILKKIVPVSVVRALRPIYHRAISFLMALSYGFPARKLTVIGITGTKGKSTTADMLFAILREAGYSTALISTIRFAIGDSSEPNPYKMTLQGRGFAQAFMRRALDSGCTHLIIEITSESIPQYRHWFLNLDALIVTNIQREHIESHGSFENYVAAKRAIVDALVHSPKKHTALILNKDVPETRPFASVHVSEVIPFTASELIHLHGDDHQIYFEYAGTSFTLPIPGTFNAMNALSAIKLAENISIPLATAAKALATLPTIRGRVEHIDGGQDFLAIVDYAHTPDSLRALYSAFPTHRKICVLGSTGGGRDTWKRSEMGKIADETCEKVILTNEDPYDEDPQAIVDMVASSMQRKPEIIMDRREAIRHALSLAKSGDAVLISGKGTDPYLMGARGTKTPWSDAKVVREELERLPSRL
ncbi:MAG: UDP-N-acetylmuramyl-tripeptide synthetase [bacterium]|nr:UDP-N-acetylmuramyl-tripeptide synthetase [bacterium]MDO8742296.1 UDP-N-acetylmuramyl-tripeptide synthetase [bacterium]